MGKRKKLFFGLGMGFLCLTISLIIFLSENERFVLQGNLFDKTQYFFSKQGKAIAFFDLNIENNTFLKSSGPPFLVSGKTLAVFGQNNQDSQDREIKEYIVQENDSLNKLSQDFNISLETILWANDLTKNSLIKPEQKLIIMPVSGILHLVKQEDSLSVIAKTHKVNLEEIVNFNQLNNQDDIFIGDLLIIPHGKMPSQSFLVSQQPLANSYFIFPAEGIISQGAHGPFGNAVDIANKCGSPVAAAASGKIQRAGSISIGGKRITILHGNGVVSYYGHLSSIAIKSGQEVKTGDIIGYIGNTGYALGNTGCHLHFETRGANNFLTKYPLKSQLKWGQ